MRYLLHALVIVTVLVCTPCPSRAQVPGGGASTVPSPELDLRVGALWPEENAQARVAVGGRLALRPWTSSPMSRVSLQFTGDFRSLGGDNEFDDAFQLQRRITRNRFILGAAIGVDVLRTTRTAIDGCWQNWQRHPRCNAQLAFVVSSPLLYPAALFTQRRRP